MSSSTDFPSPVSVVPPWMSRLYKDDQFEELDNTPIEVRSMPSNVREALWSFSEEVLGAHHANVGLASQACRILERYCVAFVKKNMDISLSEWEVKILEMKEKFMLLLAVSLMLASKIESTQSYINRNSLVQAFQRHGKGYSLLDINAAELDVFIAIDYRLPLWSNVQKVHMLVKQLGCSDHTMLAAGMLMDLVDLQLPHVYERFRIHAIDSPSPVTSRSALEHSQSPFTASGELHIRSLHLLAGVVVATVRFIRPAAPDVAPTLARWCRAPVCYVRWLANIIFQFMADRIADNDRKRHRDSVDRSDSEARGTGPKRQRSN